MIAEIIDGVKMFFAILIWVATSCTLGVLFGILLASSINGGIVW